MIKQQFQNLVIWYTIVYSIRHFTVLITCNNSYIFASFCISGTSNLTAISVHIATVFFLFLFSFMPLLNKIGFSPPGAHFACNNSILLPFGTVTLVYCISMGSTVPPSDLSSFCFGELGRNCVGTSCSAATLFFVPFHFSGMSSLRWLDNWCQYSLYTITIAMLKN